MFAPVDLFDLTGKTALVTGGATGIGRMASEGLAAAGARVFIASRKIEACEGAAREINDLGYKGRVEAFSGDVGNEQGVNTLADIVLRRCQGKLHILVNNAGVSWGKPLGEFPYDAWARVMDVNVTGMFHLTQALLPALAASATDLDPARVVNVASVMGQTPLADGAYSYAVSKAGVIHLTEILANELASRRITVNALAPGPFESKMTAFVTAKEETRSLVAQSVPLGRLGRAQDIAGSLQYLCGAAGAYVTGASIPISGGMNVPAPPSLFDKAVTALKAS